MDDLADRCPLRYFRLLPDPRVANVRHRLVDILLTALCAMICDADGWDDLEDFAGAKASWFPTFMDLRHGVPCADTFRRVISRLDPEALKRCFMDWMSAVVGQSRDRLVAIDGKSLRRSFEQGWGKSGMAHMVSAWPGIKSVVCVQADREVIGRGCSVQRRYYISSLAPDAAALGGAIRRHWGIENGLHHVLDVSFHEDDSRIRRGHGPQNVSRLRRITLNLLKRADRHTTRKSFKGRRKIAGWDHQFLLNLILE